jgi:hypothetical protein
MIVGTRFLVRSLQIALSDAGAPPGMHNSGVTSTTLTPQLERELSDLQRRAYGPNPDIHLDAAALARLRELEALSQTISTVSIAGFGHRDEEDVAIADDADAATDTPAEAEPASVDPLAAVEAPSETTQDAETAVPAKPRAAWRSPRTWILIAIGAVVGAAIVLAFLWAGARPDATLPQVERDSSGLDADSYLNYLEIEPDGLQSHGTYGELGVWTGTTTRGLSCLLITVGVSIWDQSCVPAGIDPLVDVTVFEGDLAARELDLPHLSVIRFIAKGDVVEVWVSLAPEVEVGSSLSSLLP